LGRAFAHLCLERINLRLQRFVLLHLALQKAAVARHLFSDALGREQIDVLEFVFALKRRFGQATAMPSHLGHLRWR